jgi:cytochrome c peroxidase
MVAILGRRARLRQMPVSRLLLFVVLAACANEQSTPAPKEPRDPNDPDAVISAEARAALAALSPAELPAPPPDISNRLADDPQAAAFGQALFFDASFSGKLLDGDNDGSANALGQKGESGKVACAGCHLPASGFVDTRTIQQQTSLAAGWGKRRAPSLLDVGQSKLLMWDGRRDAMYNQIFAVLESPVEMNSSRLFAARQVFASHRDAYEELFGSMPPLDDSSRFPALDAELTGCQKLDATDACPEPMRGAPGDGAEYDGMKPDDQRAVTQVIVNIGKALGAYERLLTCGPSRFDKWVHGDTSALTNSEQRGAALFVGAGHCSDCHSGPYFSDEKFHNVGLKPGTVATVFLDLNDHGAAAAMPLLRADPLNVQGAFSDGDDGRIPLDDAAALEGGFRTPKLRCASLRPSFMHTGQLRDLAAVVGFFDRGGDIAGYPGTNELKPLGLTARARADLVAFLEALTGPGPSAELIAPP